MGLSASARTPCHPSQPKLNILADPAKSKILLGFEKRGADFIYFQLLLLQEANMVLEAAEKRAIQTLLKSYDKIDATLIIKAVEADQRAVGALRKALDELEVERALLEKTVKHINNIVPESKSVALITELEESKALIGLAFQRVQTELKNIQNFIRPD